MKFLKCFGLLIVITQLNACAVVSKTDCMQGNWQKIGYEVGFDGDMDLSAAFSKRATVCSKHGVDADLVAFKIGHEEGIEDFCEISNAVNLGARGNVKVLKQQVCPEEAYPGFEAAHAAGYKLHRLEADAQRAKHEYERLQDNAYNGQTRISNLRARLNSDRLSSQDRQNIRQRIRWIARDVNEARRNLRHVRKRYLQLETAAERYRNLLKMEYPESLN